MIAVSTSRPEAPTSSPTAKAAGTTGALGCSEASACVSSKSSEWPSAPLRSAAIAGVQALLSPNTVDSPRASSASVARVLNSEGVDSASRRARIADPGNRASRPWRARVPREECPQTSDRRRKRQALRFHRTFCSSAHSFDALVPCPGDKALKRYLKSPGWPLQPQLWHTGAAQALLLRCSRQRDLPKQTLCDQAMERQNRREIDAAKPIMGKHKRRGRDFAANPLRGDVHHNTKVQMVVVEARNQPLRRLAQNRK